MADIQYMISMRCTSCGTDVGDVDARFCSNCGALVPTFDGDDEVQEKPKPAISLDSAEIKQYATWGGIVAGVVALIAVGWVFLGGSSGDDDAQAVAPATTTTVETTTTTVPQGDEPTQAMELIYLPVTDSVTIEYPRSGGIGRYHQDGQVVTVSINGEMCERSDGLLKVGGTIRNHSQNDQTLDYVIGVDFSRAFPVTHLAHVEATVTGLAPNQAVDWYGEAPSERLVTVKCVITDVTVTPTVADTP